MARVTTEDCLQNSKIKNHFDLSICASQRARNIISGAPLSLETNNDKPVVIALREIAEKLVDPEVLRHKMINGFLSSAYNSALQAPPVEEEKLATNEEIVENYYEDIAFSATGIEEDGDNTDGLNEDNFADDTSKYK